MIEYPSEEALLENIAALSKDIGDESSGLSAKMQRLVLLIGRQDWRIVDEFLATFDSAEERSLNYKILGMALAGVASQAIEDGRELDALEPLERAERVFQDQEAFQKEGLFGFELWALTSRADILQNNNREPEALELYKTAERICRVNKVRPPSLIHSMWQQIKIAKKQQKLADAIEACKRLEADCEDMTYREDLAHCLSSHALCILQNGESNTIEEWQEVLEVLTRQEVICREIGDRNLLYSSIRNQVWPLMELGRMEEAMKALIDSVDFAIEHNDLEFVHKGQLFQMQLLLKCKSNPTLAKNLAEMAKEAAIYRGFSELTQNLDEFLSWLEGGPAPF